VFFKTVFTKMPNGLAQAASDDALVCFFFNQFLRALKSMASTDAACGYSTLETLLQ
jgi:hypothetical protein